MSRDASKGRWFGPPPEQPTSIDGQPALRLGEKILLRRLMAGETVKDVVDDMGIGHPCAYAWMRQARLRFGVATTAELKKIVTERGLLEDGS